MVADSEPRTFGPAAKVGRLKGKGSVTETSPFQGSLARYMKLYGQRYGGSNETMGVTLPQASSTQSTLIQGLVSRTIGKVTGLSSVSHKQ